MADDPQNPIPEENSIPVSPPSFDSAQDLPESPILDAPISPQPSPEATAGRDNPVVNQPESHKKPEKLLNKYVIPNNKGDN